MDTKFCTACQSTRTIEGGMIKKAGKVHRWVCRVCQERKNISPYLSASRKQGADDAVRK